MSQMEIGRQTPLEAAGIVEQPHLSFSQLNTYLSCGTKYDLSYRQRVDREPQGALLGGSAIHATIAVAEDTGLWTPEVGEADPLAPYAELIEEFRARFTAAVEGAGGPEAIRWGGRGGGENEHWWLKYGEFMLRRYVTTRQAWEAEGYVTPAHGTEMRVLAELPGVRRPVVGYLDKFMLRQVDAETGEVGGYGVVDWKTGKVGYIDPLQFATYARLVRLVYDIEVEWATAVFLRAADAERRVAPVTFLPLVERMDEVYAAAEAGIDAGRFVPSPSSFCKSCSVRHACWYWQGIGGDEGS